MDCVSYCVGVFLARRERKNSWGLWGAISSENNMTVVFFFANVFLIYAELAWFRAEMCCESGPVWSERSVKINHQLNCDQWGWTTRRSLRRGNVTTGICLILHFRCPLCSINNKTRNYWFCVKFLYSPYSLALSCQRRLLKTQRKISSYVMQNSLAWYACTVCIHNSYTHTDNQ